MSSRSPHPPIPSLRRLPALFLVVLAALLALIPGPGVAASQDAPTVTAVEVTSDAGSDSTYALGETIQVTLTFSEAVNVTGSPRLKIDMDPADWGTKDVPYESGTGTASLTFAHTVVEPNYSTQGIAVLENSLELNGGTVRSASGTEATLTHNGLAHDANHKVDWQLSPPAPTPTPEPAPASTPSPAPSVTDVEVSSTPGADQTYALGETISVTLTFSETVNVTGSPRLKIDMDPADWGTKDVPYESGTGTASLTFAHEVVEPNISTQGIAVLENSLELNGGTIRSASSQADAGLSHDGLGHDANHKVDWRWQTTTPTPTPTPTPEPTPTPTPTGLHVSIEASPDKPLVNESVNLSAVIANAPSDSNPSYTWEAEANGAWHSFGNNSTLSFLASKSESWSFRVTVSYGNGDSATSDPLTVTWLNANNRGPVAATKAANYAHFTGPLNAPRGTLVSKDFTGIFTDPDGDDLTYTASVPAEYAGLVETLDPVLLPRRPNDPHDYHRLFFTAEDDADWNAVSPARPDPLVVTVTLTATDPGGLSASVEGDYLVHWESHPALQGATSSGPAIELTFDQAVQADPAPASGQFTVNVVNEDGTAGTIAVNGVSVDGAVVTLELASAPVEGQTVTLDYTHDDDAPLKRAADGGDHAPGFTGQAVTASEPDAPPTGLRLSPARLADAAAPPERITASWDAQEGATSYNLQWRRDGASAQESESLTLPGDRTSADFEVEGAGKHDVTLEVYGSEDLITAYSNHVDVRVTARLNAVFSTIRDARSCETAIDGFAAVFTNDGVELSWDDPGIPAITGYQVAARVGSLTLSATHRQWTDIPGSHAGITSHTLTSLAMNTTYGVWIHAVAGEQRYCSSTYAWITPFDVSLPTITGFEADQWWDDGPQQLTLSWDDPGDDTLSYEYELHGVTPAWADAGPTRNLDRSAKTLAPEVVWSADGKRHATISGLPCEYYYFRVWIRAKQDGNYGPQTVANYVYLDTYHGNARDNTRTAEYDHTGNCLMGWGGDDRLYGGDGDDILKGHGGNDILEGRGGDDWLDGGNGGDRLDGGSGTDTADYAGSGAGVTVSLATGSVSGGHAAGDTLISIENLSGSDHADTLTGNSGNNVLRGGGGGDALTGGGIDTADYSGSPAAVKINLDATAACHDTTLGAGSASGGHAGGDSLTGIENLIGSDHDDLLCGDSGDNILRGGPGADTLQGGLGIDTADYSGSPEGVDIGIELGGFGGHAQGDEILLDSTPEHSIENLTGSDHNDILNGDARANVLRGGGGDDILNGSAGADTLYGGPGDDTLNGGIAGLDRDIKLYGGPGDDTLIVEAVRHPTTPSRNELYFHEGFGRDTVRNFAIDNDTIFLCGMDSATYNVLNGGTYLYISVWAYEDLPYVGRTFWFQGSITMEGITSSSGNPKIFVSETCEPPVLQSASVDGTSLTLTFSETLDTGSEPAPGAFTVNVDGTGQTPTGVAISGKTVTLTLGTAVTSGQTVTVTYTVPTSNPLRGGVKPAVGFSGQVVPNNAPVTLVKNTGQANSFNLTFDEDYAIPFTTGASADGYTLTSVEVRGVLTAPAGATSPSFTVEIRTGSGTSVGSSVGSLTVPSFTAGTNTFTSSSGIDLDANTSYFVVLDLSTRGDRGPGLGTTASDNEDSGGAAGWTIGDQLVRRLRVNVLDWTLAGGSNVIEVDIKGHVK